MLFRSDEDIDAIDYVKEGGEYIPVNDGSKISASTLCERFLFDGTMQHTKIKKLSGGERRRIYLLRILMESPNVLLLDEPTNDLDIRTLNILENFLDDFAGIVVTVSHDRYFLDRICNKIFSYEDKKIKIYNGNYSDYEIKREIIKSKEIKPKIKEKKDIIKKREKQEKLKFTYNEKKEFDDIYNVVKQIEDKIDELGKEVEKNASSYSKLQKIISEKEEIEEELLEKYERIEYLEDKKAKIEEYKKGI